MSSREETCQQAAEVKERGEFHLGLAWPVDLGQKVECDIQVNGTVQCYNGLVQCPALGEFCC